MPITADAAERLGIKPRSVVQLIKRGVLAAEKRGRDYWIEDAEVERYARERRPAHRPKIEIAHKIAHSADDAPGGDEGIPH